MLKAFLSKTVIDHEVFEIKHKVNFENFVVEAKKLEHGCECLGFSFIEKDNFLA